MDQINWVLVEELEDELYQKSIGYTTTLEITPDGSQNGLDYGPKMLYY